MDRKMEKQWIFSEMYSGMSRCGGKCAEIEREKFVCGDVNFWLNFSENVWFNHYFLRTVSFLICECKQLKSKQPLYVMSNWRCGMEKKRSANGFRCCWVGAVGPGKSQPWQCCGHRFWQHWRPWWAHVSPWGRMWNLNPQADGMSTSQTLPKCSVTTYQAHQISGEKLIHHHDPEPGKRN